MEIIRFWADSSDLFVNTAQIRIFSKLSEKTVHKDLPVACKACCCELTSVWMNWEFLLSGLWQLDSKRTLVRDALESKSNCKGVQGYKNRTLSPPLSSVEDCEILSLGTLQLFLTQSLYLKSARTLPSNICLWRFIIFISCIPFHSFLCVECSVSVINKMFYLIPSSCFVPLPERWSPDAEPQRFGKTPPRQ